MTDQEIADLVLATREARSNLSDVYVQQEQLSTVIMLLSELNRRMCSC